MAEKVKQAKGAGTKPASAPGRRRRRAGPGKTRLSAKNQVTIPVDVMRESGLGSGDVIRVESAGPGRVVLQSVESLIEKYAGCAPSGTFPPGYLKELRKEWDRPWD